MTHHARSGLAAAAVGALALTGIALVPAGAASAAGPGVVLLSFFNAGHDATERFDGDHVIGLAAQVLDPTATITFEYNPNPNATDSSAGWTSIGAPTVAGGYARYDWTAPPALVGTSIAVRAVATAASGTTYSTRQGVAVTGTTSDSGPHGVSFYDGSIFVTTVDPTVQGYFVQPYADSGRTATRAAVTAFTSATSGNGALSWWNPTSQKFQGTVNAQVQPYELKVSGPSPSVYQEGGTFSGDLDLTPYGVTPGAVIAMGAELDTDDVRPRTLYAQTVTNFSAEAADNGAGQPTTVVLTVTDQSGRPIAGVEVRRGDGSLAGYTDATGVVRDAQVGGALPSSYYANTTDANAYEAGTDLQTAPVLYTPAAEYTQLVSTDGKVFDDDEYAAGDLYLRLDDQYRVPVPAGSSVSYRIYRTGTTPPATYQTATSDARGRAAIPFDPAGPDGEYTVDYHLGTSQDTTSTFTAGDSVLSLTPAAGAAGPGGTVAFSGSLKVGGQPLAGRRVKVTYKRGIGLFPSPASGDASIVGGADKGLSLTVTTDATGGFSFSVADPRKKPQGSEIGGKVTATTIAATGGALTGDPKEVATGTTTFGTKKGKGKLKLSGSSKGAKDAVRAKGSKALAGEKVKLYKVVGGKLEAIGKGKVGRKGTVVLMAADTNGRGVTTYVVKLLTSKRVKGSTSKKLKLP